MKDLIDRRIEEATNSASVYALFDGETMIGWPDVREPQWPYSGAAPTGNDQDIANRAPTYSMSKKMADLDKEIPAEQKPGNPGWFDKISLGGEKPIRTMREVFETMEGA